jgi:CheY-like chemotaxis protein
MILFVDDEAFYTDSYRRELELSGFEVEFQPDVDGALGFLGNNLDQVDLLILDIMMPSGSSIPEVDTAKGLRTGVRFYERVRKQSSRLPVIILTNVSDQAVRERFASEVGCRFLRKEECQPFELVEEVRRILAEERKEG